MRFLAATALSAAANFASDPVPLHAQIPSFDEAWRWVRFTTETGLPAADVLDLVETPSTVWALTGRGLAYYDDFFWHLIGLEGGSAPQSIVAGPAGGILALADGKLYRGSRDGFAEVPLSEDGVPLRVDAAAPFQDGSILVLAGAARDTSLILYRLQDGQLSRFPMPASVIGGRGLRLVVTWPGRVWLATEGGWYAWDSAGWVRTWAQDADIQFVGTAALVESESGEGFGTVYDPPPQRGLYHWTDSTPPARVESEGQISVVALEGWPDGSAMVAYETGDVRAYRDGSWSSLDLLPWQAGDLRFLKRRSNGDVWVGTSEGLYLYRESSTRWHNTRHPFPDARNRVNRILYTRDGWTWLATTDGLELRRPDGSTQSLRRVAGVDLRIIAAIAEDSSGNIWVSGHGLEGVLRWDGRQWRRFGSEDGFPARSIIGIDVDSTGRVWFAALGDTELQQGQGLYYFDGRRFQRWERAGFPDTSVSSVAVEPDGTIWLGMLGRLSRWRDGRWTHWTTRDGLVGSEFVSSLAVDGQGRLWFASRTKGIGSVEPDDWLGFFTTADGLIDDRVWEVAFDRTGRLWATTERGLATCHDGVWSALGAATGLQAGQLRPVVPLADRVLIGSRGGGGTYVLSRDEERDPPPRVMIREPRRLGEGQVVMSWTAAAFWGELPQREIETRYRVDGGTWTDWNLVREVRLTDLSWGDHRLEVQAKGLFGKLSDRNDELAFAVPAPPYLQPVVALPLLVLMAAIVVLVAVTVRRRRKHEAELRERDVRFRAFLAQSSEGMARFEFDAPLAVDLPVDEQIDAFYERIYLAECNDAWARFHGRQRAADMIGMRLTQSLDPNMPMNVNALREFISSGYRVADSETHHVTGDGKDIYLRSNATAIVEDGHLVRIWLVGRDVTERKQADLALQKSRQQLRILSQRLMSVQETERAHVARELHDGIGQALTVVKLNLFKLGGTSNPGTLPPELGDSLASVDAAFEEVRNLALNLRPSLLDDMGLAAALHGFTERQAERAGISATITADTAAPRPPREVETACFRVAQEAITNVLRHSSARSLWVELRQDEDQLELTVRDDGVGFEMDARGDAAGSGRMGLLGMSERVMLSDGAFSVESQRGRGTVVRASFPLP